jgi:hypothetical protein
MANNPFRDPAESGSGSTSGVLVRQRLIPQLTGASAFSYYGSRSYAPSLPLGEDVSPTVPPEEVDLKTTVSELRVVCLTF